MSEDEQRVIDTFLAAENKRLRAERDEWRKTAESVLMAKVTAPPEELEQLRRELVVALRDLHAADLMNRESLRAMSARAGERLAELDGDQP
jgi:hypothetical protein